MCGKKGNCVDRSEAIYHQTGALTGNGTAVTIALATQKTKWYSSVTVVNDTDQDIRVNYKTTKGYVCSFIVPKSIRGFTKQLIDGSTFDTASFSVVSLSASSNATGNITFNFGA